MDLFKILSVIVWCIFLFLVGVNIGVDLQTEKINQRDQWVATKFNINIKMLIWDDEKKEYCFIKNSKNRIL